jgi:transcriptional regulator with XRE-family HTH domain
MAKTKLMALRLELARRRWSQAELGRLIDRSAAHICRLVLGRIPARARDRRRIAAALGLPESDLFPCKQRSDDSKTVLVSGRQR